MKTKHVIAILLITSLTGCAPSQYMAMSKEHKNNIKSSKCIILKKQKNIKVNYHHTDMPAVGGMGILGGAIGGLLVGAANSHRADAAEKNAEIIRKEITGYNVEENIKKEIEPVLKKIQWLHLKEVEVVESYDEKSEEDLINKAAHNTDVITVIKTNYLLSPNLKNLEMDMILNVYPASGQLKLMTEKNNKDNIRPIYSTKVKNNWELKHESASNFKEDKNIVLWSANKGETMKKALDDSITSSIKNIAQHLADPEILQK